MSRSEIIHIKRAFRVEAVGIVAGIMMAVVMAICWCSVVM